MKHKTFLGHIPGILYLEVLGLEDVSRGILFHIFKQTWTMFDGDIMDLLQYQGSHVACPPANARCGGHRPLQQPLCRSLLPPVP